MKISNNVLTVLFLLLSLCLLSVQATADDLYDNFNLKKEIHNPSDAFDQALKRGLKAKDLQSYYIMGRLVAGYERHTLNDRELDAYGWHLIAAKQGYAPSQYHIAEYVLDLYERAERHDHVYDTKELITENPNEYRQILESLSVSPSDAVTWLHMAGVDLYPQAPLLLSRVYEEGWFVPENRDTALFWLKRGVSLSHPGSLAMYGKVLMEGRLGETKNSDLGFSKLNQAAELGDVDSMIYLGDEYFSGRELDRDYEKSASYYHQCAYAFYLKTSKTSKISKTGRNGITCKYYLANALHRAQDYEAAYAWRYIDNYVYEYKRELIDINSLESEFEVNYDDKLTAEQKSQAIDFARECIVSDFKTCKL